jgi:ActR/RegA family two-component response regulator
MAFGGVMARLPRLHGRAPVTARPISQLPRSTVLVLDDEIELRAAVERAITFERGVALRTAENISRYEQMAAQGILGEYLVSDAQLGDQIALNEQESA